MSLPQNVITVTTILPHHIHRPRGITVKFHAVPAVTAFFVTVSSFTVCYDVCVRAFVRTGASDSLATYGAIEMCFD